jgi:hypothetical protein
MYITHRPSLNKLKYWHTENPRGLYDSLRLNRDIQENDLDIYEVTDGTEELMCKKSFSFPGENTLTITRKVLTEQEVTHAVEWYDLPEESYPHFYTQAEQDTIAANKLLSNKEDWAAVPTKDVISVMKNQSEEVIQTIAVTKLNPFV